VEFYLKIEGLEELQARLRTASAQVHGELVGAMWRSVFTVERNVKMRTPVDTGRLRSSIGSNVEALGGAVTGYIGTNVEYAPHVEFGTGPHVIVPRRARCLHWVSKAGEHVFAMRVQHPGTKARRMFQEGLEASEDEVVRHFEGAAERIVRWLAS